MSHLISSSQCQRFACLARCTGTSIADVWPAHGILQLIASIAGAALTVHGSGGLILAGLAAGILSRAALVRFTSEAAGETVAKVAPLALIITLVSILPHL